MEPKDEKAVRWAIGKYWKQKSDQQLSEALSLPIEKIVEMREQMGHKRTETLKDYARRYLLEMGEEEKKEFMRALPKDLIWRMAEGQPHTTEDTTITHIVPQPIMRLEAYEAARNALPSSTP